VEPIYPVTAETCSRFAGMPVCVVLHDGTRHYGILSRVEGGKVILNDAPQALTASKKNRKQTNRQVKTSAKNKATSKPASVSDFGYGNPAFFPFGGRIALDLAAIAFLFLLFI
jgi:hypothetical protein